MKTRSSLPSRILMLVFVLCMAVQMTACSGEPDESPSPNVGQPVAPDAEFVFRGTGTATNGRTLTFVITGNEDETLEVAVEELPALRMGGSWVLEENKGYKLYFDDGSDSLEYTKYDPEAKEFSFTTNINAGSYGSPEVHFTCKNEAFAEAYDGVGLGRKPPVFNLSGWYGGILETPAKLNAKEDGTFIVSNRTGTWSYDGEADAYSFTFDAGVLFVNGREITQEAWKIPPRGHPEVPVEEYVDRSYALGRDEIRKMAWEEYVERNYCKGPYITTYDAATATYTLSIDLDFIMEEITLFTGTCTFAD